MAKKKKYKTALDYYNEKNNIKKSDSKKIAKLNADIITGKIINPSAENKQEQINKKQQKKVKDLKKKVDEEKKELGIYEKYKSNQQKMNQNLFISSQDRTKHYTDKSQTKKTAEKKREEELKKTQQERKEIDKNYEENSELYQNYAKEKNDSYLTQYLADEERVKNEKVTTLDKMNVFRTLLASADDALDDQHEYTLENGSKVSLPTYRELKTAQVDSELGTFGKAIHGAASSLGANTPAMITSLATSAIPVVGKPLSRVTGGVMTYATIYNSAKNQKLLEGYSEKEADNYAKVNASLETGLSTAIGGFSKAIGGNGTLLTKGLAKISDKILKNEGTKYFVSHLVAEEVEELTQMVLDPINEHVTLGEYENLAEALSTIDKDEALITALSTLFSIGLTEGPTAVNINTLSKNIDAINKEYGTDFRIKPDSKQVVDNKTNKKATERFEELKKKSKISKYQEQQITELETRAMQIESDYETGKITEEQYKEETQKISTEAKIFKQEQDNNEVNPITEIEAEKEMLDEKFNSNLITEQEYDKQVAELDNKLKEIAGKDENNNKPIEKEYTGNSKLSFSEQVDKWKNGEYNKNAHLIVLKETPEVYRKLGLDNLEMTITSNKMDRVYNDNGKQKGTYHGLKEMVKQLPEALSNPLNIVESTTDPNSIVVVTRLGDMKDNIVVVSIKPNGNGQIEIENITKNISANVLTSVHGRENYDYQLKQRKDGTYTGWMEDNAINNRIIYDIDEGIKKQRVKGQWVSFPNSNNSFSDTNIPQNNKNVKSSNVSTNNIQKNRENIPKTKQTSKILNEMKEIHNKKITIKEENKTTKKQKKQEPLPINKEVKNAIEPVKKDIKTITDELKSLREELGLKESKVLTPNKIANTTKEDANTSIPKKRKQRKWIETSTKSKVVNEEIGIEDLDISKITYEPISNKKTMKNADAKLSVMSYDEAVAHIKDVTANKTAKLEDIGMAERLIQEAIKRGDKTTASELIMDTAMLGTDLGQKVQALSIIKKMTPEGQLKMLQKVVKRGKLKDGEVYKNVEITQEMTDKILDVYNEDGTFDADELNTKVEEVKQEIAEQLKPTIGDKISEWRYISMLGNPKTHIRNIISNVAMTGTIKYKNAIARTIETVVPTKNKTKTWKRASKEVSEFAKQTTLEMKSEITGESKYNEKTSIELKKKVFKNKVLDKISKFNSDALTKEDWFFSKGAFESSFKEYLTAQNIKTMTDIESHPKIIEDAKNYALEQAEIATFRQYSWLASQISRLENKNALGKVGIGSTMPFKKTPINVAKAGVNYSPIGLIKSISYDAVQVSKGNMEASQLIDNFAQGLTGTSIALIGYALAKSGLLSGAGDDDKEDKYNRYLGEQSYSLKIGNHSYPISWLSPVAMPLLVGATAFEQLEEKEEWDMNVVTETLAKTLDPLSEMSFLSSLDDVLSSYDSGFQKFQGMAIGAGQNYVTQFFPTLFSQLASVLDDKKRTTQASKNSKWVAGEELGRQIMYKVPGLRNELEPSLDIWGREIKQSENYFQRAYESFLAPYSKKKDISTNLDKELKRVYKSTGETEVIPNIPKSYLQYKDEKYKMSAFEYTIFKKNYGTTANEYLNVLIENENYKSSTDEEKVKMISEIYGYASVLAKEKYFKTHNINYENDDLKEIKKLKELDMTNQQICEYVSMDKKSSTIKNNDNLESEDKRVQISKLLSKSNLTDSQLAYLYDKYYGSTKTINSIVNANISMKEFIKYNSKKYTSDKDSDGDTIKNSRKNKIFSAINSLKLTKLEKAMLMRTEYSSFDDYNYEIFEYVNKLSLNKSEKQEIFETLGFEVKGGRVYW